VIIGRRRGAGLAGVAATVALGVTAWALTAGPGHPFGPASDPAAGQADMVPAMATAPRIIPWVASTPWTGSAGRPVAGVAPPAPPKPPTPPVGPVGPGGPLDAGRVPIWAVIPPNTGHVDLAPPRDCPQPDGPTVTVPMTVVPGVGSATVSWFHKGSPDVRSYELEAVPMPGGGAGQGAPVSRTVAPPTSCQRVTVTVTGLVSGAKYRFYLETVNTDNVGHRGTVRRTNGVSETITTL